MKKKEFGKCCLLSKTPSTPVSKYTGVKVKSFTTAQTLTKHYVDCLKLGFKPNKQHKSSIEASLKTKGVDSKYYIEGLKKFCWFRGNVLVLKEIYP
jgi:hypothetical protein